MPEELLRLELEFQWAGALQARVSLEGGAPWSYSSSGYWIGLEKGGLGMDLMVGIGPAHTPGTLVVGTCRMAAGTYWIGFCLNMKEY